MLESDHQPMRDDPILQRIVPALAEVPGVAAIALGGSRARGTATETSDYDIGLYYAAARPLDTARLLQAARMLVDKPEAAEVTPVGGWGPWIVGGGWLSVDGRKVDLLYRSIEAVSDVIEKCRAGEIAMHYQPGHPHGFCSAIWMGEVALCQPLHDPEGRLARLKAATSPYPAALRDALIRKFEWEILFSIENGELAAGRGEQTHAAGCAYRALACAGLVLFALNERYLINEKGALQEAACLPLTIPDIAKRAADIWRLIGSAELRAALAGLRGIERDVKQLTSPRGNRS
jgi:predicted nucleotidyltransferase